MLKKDDSDSNLEIWKLTISEKSHSHPLAPNPLIYIQHKRRHHDYQQAVAQAIDHRYAGLSYNTSLHLRIREEFQLNSKAYYNSKRSSNIRVTSEERIDRMLKELTNAGFHTRSRWVDKLNTDGTTIAKQLEQIFFINADQIRLGRRFVSDFVMECDATFSNNLLRMPLANVVGITNTGRTFSLAFSFIRSESAENFNFIFNSLDELVFYNLPRPKIVLSDQAKGFIKSLNDSWASETTFHQLCEWHMFQNIKKRPVEGAYNKEQQDRIQHLVWKYIHCLTQEGATEARHELYYELHTEERKYMEENWRPKERQVLRYYTRSYANLGKFYYSITRYKILKHLGAYSTQRNEGHHVAVKQFLNPQITLEQAALRLIEHLRHAVFCLDTEEAESRTKVPRFLNSSIFIHLIGYVTLFAINLIKVEWEEAKGITELEDCDCTIIQQFGLPCRHRLAAVCFPMSRDSEPIPIPITLLHPRWRIDEPPAISSTTAWIMPLTLIDNTQDVDPPLLPLQRLPHDRYIGNGQDLLLKCLHELEILHGDLNRQDAEAAEHMAQQTYVFTKALQQDFGPKTTVNTQPIPRIFAPTGLASTFPKRKVKGKAKLRTLTSTEAAERRNKRPRTARHEQLVEPGPSQFPYESASEENDGLVSEETGRVSEENETQDCIHVVVRSTAPA